jgi:drug/metabolite transporter (DMT)-like permease
VTRNQLGTYGILSLIWGFSFLLLVKAIEGFGWVGAVTFRSFIASALLLIVATGMRRKLTWNAPWFKFAVVGSTTVAGQLIGMTYATPHIGTAMAAIFVGAIPLFSMVIGTLWGHESMSRRGVVGLVMGIVGIVMLVGFPAVAISPEFLLGSAGSMFGSLSAAIGSNYARRELQDVGSWEQTIGAFFFGGLVSLPLILVVPVPGVPDVVDFVYLIALAGLVSSVAYALYFRLVSEIGATKAISVEFIVTVIAVIVGAVVLKEQLSLIQLIGGAVIITGCVLVLEIKRAVSK